jgi:hypothetical protein
MPDVIVGPSPVQRTGVFAARDFAANETVLLIDDSRVVDGRNPLRRELGEREHHCDYLADGKMMLMQSPERYINSSCDPNTYVKTTDGVRQVIVFRRIGTGGEVTYDYIVNCHCGVRWTCNCGSPRCRGEVAASFFDLPKADQRRLLPLLDAWFVNEHRERIEALMGPECVQ